MIVCYRKKLTTVNNGPDDFTLTALFAITKLILSIN